MPPDLHDVNIEALGSLLYLGLEGVGDVRDVLHCLASVFASTLVGNDFIDNAASHHTAGLGEFLIEETLVVPEVEVGLGAVFGDEAFAVLAWVERTSIDV